MLVAKRDPPFHSDPHDVPHPSVQHTMHARSSPRFITALQVAGSALGIPVGLVSGYSIYHANFSAEAHCQGLRANIVSVLDKSADASTLRMLVRRDVASFEANCGAVNPDAAAAFKRLLASDKTVRTAPRPARVAPPPHVETTKVVVVPKPAPRAAESKPTAERRAIAAESKPEAESRAITDANWVASVRQALVRETTMQTEEAKASPPPVPAAPPHPLGELRKTSPSNAVAPALPPAAAVAATPEPAGPSDHPVPPASIPEGAPVPHPAQATQSERHGGLGSLIADIPLLGRVVGR
jgi:hypothetical protein